MGMMLVCMHPDKILATETQSHGELNFLCVFVTLWQKDP
jgi:hypothetical protein